MLLTNLKCVALDLGLGCKLKLEISEETVAKAEVKQLARLSFAGTQKTENLSDKLVHKIASKQNVQSVSWLLLSCRIRCGKRDSSQKGTVIFSGRI